MKIWRPKDPKAKAIIKLTLWSALVTWAIFSVAFAIVLARKFVTLLRALPFFEANSFTRFLGEWVVPIWVIFTSLMLVWAIFRYANKMLRRRK